MPKPPVLKADKQTLANRTKPGLSFQLLMWACINNGYMYIIKTA